MAVAIANANAATIAALELLNAAVMTSPLDLTFDQSSRLLVLPAMQLPTLVPLRFSY